MLEIVFANMHLDTPPWTRNTVRYVIIGVNESEDVIEMENSNLNEENI